MKLTKLPKRKVTVDELLGHDDVMDCMERASKAKTTMTEVMIIWRDGNDDIHRTWAGARQSLLWSMKMVENDMMNIAYREDDNG